MKMNWIDKNDWHPADGFELEMEAMNTVIENINTLVVAGPGAGKTELLAQRASFLLETNSCRYPKKILAISFKKDAAENLKERIDLRCGKELSLRFESKTYDAFAKEILDRFINSIDEKYRPLKQYKIANSNDVSKAFKLSGLKFQGRRSEFNRLYGDRLASSRLPLNTDMIDQIFINTWNTMLKGNFDNDVPSMLTFQMISRLSEYLIRTNVYIKRAIEKTYSHVFLDEFQDTTSIQYELIKTCFHNTSAIVTAVGDSKQRIMLWAGARKSIFEDYLEEFGGIRRDLIMNHRSAPRLVEIQKEMYNSLNEEELSIQTNKKWQENDGEAYLRIFTDHYSEAEIVCKEVLDLTSQGVDLKNICILVKQRVDKYGEEIINKLAENNIKARNEALYQDLLKEDIIRILISLFRLATNERDPENWSFLYETMGDLNGVDIDSNIDKIMNNLNKTNGIVESLKKDITLCKKNEFERLIDLKVEDISYEKLASKYQQYQSKDYFDTLINDFKALLWAEFLESGDWAVAIDNFQGNNSIPIMTIHKSKGLEFDTIFFIGLEDSAFWNFRNQSSEDRCAFFVALSRAKRRIDFTFCYNRPAGFNNLQSHNVINEFYEIFEDTGIVEQVNYDD